MYRKPFSEEIVQYLMKQIIDALQYLHSHKIIHRDLKLDNILVTFKNENDKNILNMYGAQIKIIDFGFATHSNKQDLHKSVLGSPLYMDPMILKKYTKKEKNIKGYTEKIDIWSLGNLCYEMLLGKPAFQTTDIKILEEKIEKGFYYVPNTFYKEVVGFLVGMLQYDADIRLSADELGKHPFLMKNVRHFERINIKEMEKYIKDNKVEIGIYEDRNLWNMFNSKYNRFLEIIPEDSDISESIFFSGKSLFKSSNNHIINGSNFIYNNSINYINKKDNNINKNKNNNKTNDELKKILKKAFDSINKDFLILERKFIPVIPGNDPKDLYNEEKQI
jgi:serine/threonine protein kinase